MVIVAVTAVALVSESGGGAVPLQKQFAVVTGVPLMPVVEDECHFLNMRWGAACLKVTVLPWCTLLRYDDLHTRERPHSG